MRTSWVLQICGLPLLLAVASTSAFGQTAIEYGHLAGKTGAPKAITPNLPQASPPQQTTPSQAAPPAPSQPPPPPPQIQQVAPGPSTSLPLRVLAGKSLLIKTADRTRRISITDSSIADAQVVTPNQILIEGRSPGEVSLVIWNEFEESRSFDLRVDVDTTPITEEIHRAFPHERIEVYSSRNGLVVSGHASTKEVAERASALAAGYSKNVINLLSFGPTGGEEILLEVKFAEVDRTALSQYGFNLFSTGAANTFGASSTQQFGGFTGSNVGAVTSDVTGGGSAPGNNLATSEIGNQLFHQPASFATNNLLNFFLFRTDINLGVLIQDLQQKNVLQILAEPNLIAVNGKEANFLAGGEFPYPVPQGITGAITIQFKDFGVRLSFIPLIKPDGLIHLQVTPEVSALDYSNSLTTNGFVIPAISTRRAATEFELKDGQSFIIAGLLDNRVTDVMSRMPGLADIPILGTFFKSKNQQKTKTELMVLVTAHRVNPLEAPAALPTFPKPFLKDKQTDTSGTKTPGQ
jgi:pilus assembly protein CpaC